MMLFILEKLDLKDDIPTAVYLFRLINYIVNNQITSKKEIENIFDGFPENKPKAIEKRDK